jgi:hypothetical protein
VFSEHEGRRGAGAGTGAKRAATAEAPRRPSGAGGERSERARCPLEARVAKLAVMRESPYYGGGQLSFVSEVFVVTTWQDLSMQYSVTPSWKIVQRLKFHPDWIPGVPVEVSL